MQNTKRAVFQSRPNGQLTLHTELGSELTIAREEETAVRVQFAQANPKSRVGLISVVLQHRDVIRGVGYFVFGRLSIVFVLSSGAYISPLVQGCLEGGFALGRKPAFSRCYCLAPDGLGHCRSAWSRGSKSSLAPRSNYSKSGSKAFYKDPDTMFTFWS